MNSNQLKNGLAALIIAFSIGNTTANAEILYKWREADGALTFSPTPPDASSGIKYEKVNSSGGKSASSHQSPGNSGPGKSGLGNSSPGNSAQVMNARPNTIQAAHPQTQPRPGAQIDQPQTASNRQSVSVPSGSRKTEHCNELRKRVLSLEKLLTTKISAETMDNAVVQMARYQSGINQACGG